MKSPTLTKEIRAQIVESVIAATFIPAEKEAILQSAGATVRETIRKLLPQGFEQAVACLPPEWLPSLESIQLHTHISVPNILADCYRSYRSIRFERLTVSNNLNLPGRISDRIRQGDDRPAWEQILAAQIDAAKKLRAKEDALRMELSNQLVSFRTYAQLLEKLPELERHLPKPPAPPMPLVANVAPLRAQMKKLGFDQGAK